MSNKVIEINDSNFDTEVLKSTIPVFVDFWAPWCGPCLIMGPVIEELANEYTGKVKMVKINVDENAIAPSQYGVRSIPFFGIFKAGKLVDTIIGAMPKNRIKNFIDQHIA